MSDSTLLSIQVGKPINYGADAISDKSFESGIKKTHVDGPVWLGALNLEGDGQADLKNHGGPFRAALAYSAEHYPVWREDLARPDFPYGGFGENFTISGLSEDTVCIGDIYTIGDAARVQVSQPRLPCWKLARRWGIKDLTARVEERAWGGWYLRVLDEGHVAAGMPVTLQERTYPQLPVRQVFLLIRQRLDDPALIRLLPDVEPLTLEWRDLFADRAADL